MSKPRLERLDELRGLALCFVVFHHVLYDAVLLLGAPRWLFQNPLITPIQMVFVGFFVMASGVSCRLSRSNARRGLRLLAVAMGLTLVTTIMDMPIVFGILHLMSVCMLLYTLLRRWIDVLPYWTLVGAFFLSWLWVETTSLRAPMLWLLGVPFPGMVSWDYYPLLPWLFLFLLGAKAGGVLLTWNFVARRPTALGKIGRHTLLIYLLHQPVLFGVFYFIKLLLKW